MASGAEEAQRHGVFLVGILEGQRPGRTYKDRDGNERTRHELGVRVGDDVVAVSYADQSSAEKALAESNGVAGETVTLLVQYRLIKKLDGSRPYAFLTIEGDTGEERDAGWRS
jgi:hypothetical protein